MQTDKNANVRHSRRGPTRSQVILLAVTGGKLVLSLAVTVLLGRILTPCDYGFFALAGTVFLVARELLDLGMGNVAARQTVRAPSAERAILEGLMGYQRLVGVALALIVLMMALTRADWQRGFVLAAAAIVVSSMFHGALRSVFQVRQAQGGPALLSVALQVLVLAGSICLYLLRACGAAFAALIVLREALNVAGIKVLAGRLLGYRPKPGLRGRGLKAFLGMAVVYGLAALVHNIYFHCDVFLVWMLRGEQELGAYAAAFRPINPLLALPWILMVPLVPVLSAAAGKDRAGFVRQVADTAGLALGIGAIGAVAGVMLAPDLISLLYGGKYLEGVLSSTNVLRWLAVALGVVYVTPIFATGLLADGKERGLLVLGLGGLLFNVAGNVLFLPRYGFVAAAVTTALTELLVCVGMLLLFTKTVGRTPLSRLWVASVLPAGAVGVALGLLGGSHVLRVGCGVALSLAGVVALLSSPAARRHRRALAAMEALGSSSSTERGAANE